MFQNLGDLIRDKAVKWMEGLLGVMPDILASVVVLVVFFGLSNLLVMGLSRALPRMSKNAAVNRLLLSITKVIGVLIGIFVALSILGLHKTVTSLLAGVGVVGLALGFAFQNAASNIISGVIIGVNSPINVGDVVKTQDYFGEVKEVGLRSTTLVNPLGQFVDIPNRLILQDPFKHYTINEKRQIRLEFRVGLEEDLEKVRNVCKEAAQRIRYALPDENIEVFFLEVEAYAIKMGVRFWIQYDQEVRNYFESIDEGIVTIQVALKENGIEIPVPIHQMKGNKGYGYPADG